MVSPSFKKGQKFKPLTRYTDSRKCSKNYIPQEEDESGYWEATIANTVLIYKMG